MAEPSYVVHPNRSHSCRAGSSGPIQAGLTRGLQLDKGQGLAHVGTGGQGRGRRPQMGLEQGTLVLAGLWALL